MCPSLSILLVALAVGKVAGQDSLSRDADATDEVLTAQQWQRLDTSVERALAWLDQQQQRDGSFPTHPGGQPAVTALCAMAFAAHGHLPGEGDYGETMSRAIAYVGKCQKQSGLIALVSPNSAKVPRNVDRDTSNNAVYNHAISATVLSEMYGLSPGEADQREVIERALKATLEMQVWPKQSNDELGGWRYLSRNPHDGYQSDLSVTAWELMFLRSAKNCGFDVPKKPIEDGVAYVLRTFNEDEKTFTLFHKNGAQRTRAMAGAGILALAHSGVHDRPENKHAAEFLLKMPCTIYGRDNPLGQRTIWYSDRYHYSACLATQAMYQMGGKYWAEHFPKTALTLIENQSPEGSWLPEKHHYDARFGNAYTTALVVLTLGTPNQLLPVFQR